jgi:hypothetical protein
LHIPKDKNQWVAVDEIPQNTIKIPIKSSETEQGGARLGLSSFCPYMGYDPSHVDKSLLHISAVYDTNYKNDESPSDTFQPHPILMPSKIS